MNRTLLIIGIVMIIIAIILVIIGISINESKNSQGNTVQPFWVWALIIGGIVIGIIGAIMIALSPSYKVATPENCDKLLALQAQKMQGQTQTQTGYYPMQTMTHTHMVPQPQQTEMAYGMPRYYPQPMPSAVAAPAATTFRTAPVPPEVLQDANAQFEAANGGIKNEVPLVYPTSN